MLYRLLLILSMALGITACIGEDDYQIEIEGEVEALPDPVGEPDPPNPSVLANGDFESADLAGWVINVNTGGGAEAEAVVVGDQFYDGEAALRTTITSIGAEQSDVEVGATAVTVSSENQYRLSAFVLGTPGAQATFLATVTGDPSTVLASETVEIRNSWQKVTFVFTLPEGVTEIDLPVQMSHDGNEGAVIYLDAVQLFEGQKPTTAAVTVDIQNPSFEDSDEGFDGWSFGASAGEAAASVSSTEAREGSNSVEVVITTPAADNWRNQLGQGGLDLTDNSSAGSHYITAWVFGTAGAVVNFTVQEDGGSYSALGSTGNVTLVDGWQLLGFEFGGVASNEGIVFNFGYPENEGMTFYIDDVTVTEFVPLGDPTNRALPVDSGWRTNFGDTPVYGSSGVSYSPTANDHQLLYDLAGPEDYHEKTFAFEITVDQAFKDSEADLQPFAQLKEGGWPGQWNCYISNGNLTANSSAVFNCVLDAMNGDVPAFTLAEGQELQIGVQAKGDAPAGTVTISAWEVDLPPLITSDLPLDSGWQVSDDTTGLVSSASGVSYSPTAEDNQLFYNITGPDYLEGATFVFTIDVTQEFIDSGASLQPIAQLNVDPWTGEWGCWIDNGDLSTSATEYSCTLDEGGAPFNLDDDTESLKVGIQAKGTPAGTVTISFVEIQYPGVSVEDGWSTNSSSPLSYDGGVSYSPAAEDENLTTNINGPNNLAGATVVLTIAASQEFLDSGANLQPYAQQNFDPWTGEWGCWINNGDLSTSAGEYLCTLGDAFNLADGESMLIGVQAKGASVAGSITISDVSIRYAD